MGRTFVFGLLMSAILLIAVAARSDVAQSPPAPSEIPDPDPHVPNTIGQTDPGPASALWEYTDLSPGEQAWVDRNRDTTGWDQTNRAFGQAVAEQAQAAAARDAATQLGLDDVADEGVVP